MEIFRFEIEREDRSLENGYFFRTSSNEILGIIEGEKGQEKAFIKGLFWKNKDLIFVKMTKEKHYKSGYAFKEVYTEKKGVWDEYDWLSGVFSGEARMEPIVLKKIRKEKSVEPRMTEKEFIQFYKKLDRWDQHYFDNVNKLEEELKYIKI